MDEAERNLAIHNCLIYYSKTENLWIAHGLRTDQIGVGDCVLDAYVDYLHGMIDLVDLSKEVDHIEIFRTPPKKILKKAEKAQLLPRELYDVAYKRVHGDWPQDLKVTTKPSRHHSLKVEGFELAKTA